MAFKLFDETNINNFRFGSIKKISLSNPSTSAQDVNFFTGLRSLGKIESFTSSAEPKSLQQISYEWKFDKSILQDSSLTAERVVGKFVSSADQKFITGNGTQSIIGHIPVFNNALAEFYHVTNPPIASQDGLTAIGSNTETSYLKLISLPKKLIDSRIGEASVRIEIDDATSSNTGIVSDLHPVTNNPVTALLTSAVDIKNPNYSTTSDKSFIVVPFKSTSLGQNISSLDDITHSISVEAIIRPYNPISTILYRRISPMNQTKTSFLSEHSFIKLELVPSPDGLNNAFRFHIRDTQSATGFSNDFAQENVQASGLFVPNDAGINLFDGKFHHIVCTWSISGFDSSGGIGDTVDTEAGAGVVVGYIDGFKLLNKEEVDPILVSSDGTGGPRPQSNMLERRIPVRQIPLSLTSHSGGTEGSSSASLFIGASNFLQPPNDLSSDVNSIPLSSDSNINGLYDGQIQSIRVWNTRLLDGTTSYKHNVNKKIGNDTSGRDIYKTYTNFYDSTLTGGSSASFMLAWWNFLERNTLTAVDVSPSYSNTATFVGNTNTRLFDHINIIKDGSIITTSADYINSSLSSFNRIFLYKDRPDNEIIKNEFDKGVLYRETPASNIIDVGSVFYDHGMIYFDTNDEFARLNWLYPASGTTGDWGFNVSGTETAFNLNRLSYNSSEISGRLMLSAIGEGEEFNFSENPTSFDFNTGQSIFDEDTTYITTIGLYNELNELIAVAKLSKPVRKDAFTKIETQIKLDF